MASQLLWLAPMTIPLRSALLLTMFTAGAAHANATDVITDEPATPPTIVVATDPIADMYEAYTLSVARRMSPHLALRADLQMSPDAAYLMGTPRQLALVAPIYFHAPFQGPYVEAGVFARQQPLLGLGYFGTLVDAGPITTAGPQVAIGWQVTLSSGFTLQAALGAQRVWTSSLPGMSGVTSTSYLRVGYAW